MVRTLRFERMQQQQEQKRKMNGWWWWWRRWSLCARPSGSIEGAAASSDDGRRHQTGWMARLQLLLAHGVRWRSFEGTLVAWMPPMPTPTRRVALDSRAAAFRSSADESWRSVIEGANRTGEEYGRLNGGQTRKDRRSTWPGGEAGVSRWGCGQVWPVGGIRREGILRVPGRRIEGSASSAHPLECVRSAWSRVHRGATPASLAPASLVRLAGDRALARPARRPVAAHVAASQRWLAECVNKERTGPAHTQTARSSRPSSVRRTHVRERSSPKRGGLTTSALGILTRRACNATRGRPSSGEASCQRGGRR